MTINWMHERLQRLARRLMAIAPIRLSVHVVQELGADDASNLAAAIAYYAILSLFPLILGLISVVGLFLPSEVVQEKLFDFFRSNLPTSVDLLERNIREIVRLRGAIGLVSLIGLFWSGSAIFGAISHAINRAWDVHKERPVHIRKLRDLTMALGISILFVLSLSMTALFRMLRAGLLGIAPAIDLTTQFVAFLLSAAIFLSLYKFIPNTKTYWRCVWPGALLAAILFEIAKNLFVFYLQNFANYQLVYGPLASVIVLLVWIYFSAFILILGAEVSSEYSRMRQGTSNRDGPIASSQKRSET